MGLDMYLSKKTYVKNWDYQAPEQRHTVIVTGPMATAIMPDRISYIVEEVGYWHKANAIHQWFVDYCQDGVDDCREAYVSREQLGALGALCRTLLTMRATDPVAADDQARTELLSQSGCFFGSTEINDQYWENVEYTATLCESLLAEPGDGEYSYHSSW